MALQFKDVQTNSAVQQLDPAQLQQILDDLTSAESIARGDVSAGSDEALAILQGDLFFRQRTQAINAAREDATKTFEAEVKSQILQELKSGNSDLMALGKKVHAGGVIPEEMVNALEQNFNNIDVEVDDNGNIKLSGGGNNFDGTTLQNINNFTINASEGLRERLVNGQDEIEAGVNAQTEVLAQQNPAMFAATESSASAFNNQALAQGQAAIQRMGDMSGLNTGAGSLSSEEIQQRLEQTPGFQFRFGQGQRAVENSAANRGLLESGALLKGLTEFGQGLASQEFGAEHARLATLAGLGSQASGQEFQNLTAQAAVASGQGSQLGQIAQAAAQQRSSSILQGGTNTTNQTKSLAFPEGFENIGTLAANAPALF